MADGERVYSGLFVSIVSSKSYKEPVIVLGGEDTNQPTVTLTIERDNYHEPRFQQKIDVRFDERVRRVLAGLGKLADRDGGPARFDEALTRKISDVLRDWKTIGPGKTRADLLKLFTTEGGISTAKQRTFVHRDCPYIKVDVEFTLTETNRSSLEERPADVIRKVSQPYLQWSIMD
jgi:hypothetical protein